MGHGNAPIYRCIRLGGGTADVFILQLSSRCFIVLCHLHHLVLLPLPLSLPPPSPPRPRPRPLFHQESNNTVLSCTSCVTFLLAPSPIQFNNSPMPFSDSSSILPSNANLRSELPCCL